MTEIKAVVFDMDGVLVDAREWHYAALNAALGLFGFEISRYDHLSTFDGLSTSQKLAILSVEQGLPEGLHAFINQMKQKFTIEEVASQCRPQFVHEYALSSLKLEGFKLGLASNAVRRSVDEMMERADLAKYLDVIVSNEDVDRAKPAPDIYEAAFERLNVLPSETLVVEDNAHGIEAARAAGAHVLVVSDPTEVSFDRVRGEIELIGTVVAS
jgi:beta-phosphoglucomutase